MALICDYFIASSDDEAAQTAAWSGGPSKPSIKTRGLFRTKVVDLPVDPFPTVELPGVEPVVALATLEELLTGESADRLVEENADAQVGDSQQGAMVFRVREQLTDALAGASGEQLRALATPWSRTEELVGADPSDLTDALQRLSALAQRARNGSGRVYCWMAA